MTSSPEIVEFVGLKAGRLPEKSSFSQTCNLLSQYLKEKGSFGDLTLGMTCNTEASANGNENGTSETMRQTAATTTMMNLFPSSEKPADVFGRNMGASRNLKSMDLFPQQAGCLKEDAQKSLDSSTVNKSTTTLKEPQTAQMTIFYGGQVIVFNDFPADKAKEVMLLAGKGIRTPFTSAASTGHPTFAAPAVSKPPMEPTKTIAPPSANPVPGFGNHITEERAQPPAQAITSDLPIARRASLHRFLEKRKDRITARAPYQTSSPLSAPPKPVESKSWLGLAAQVPQ